MVSRDSAESDMHGNADVAGQQSRAAADTASDVVRSLKGWVFIVNPASARGSTGQKWPQMLQRFKDAATAKGWSDVDDVATLMTTKPCEATELTRKSLRTATTTVVVAVGGDGSLAEVVEGFFEPGSHYKVSQSASLAYLPNGTGGDFRCTHAPARTHNECGHARTRKCTHTCLDARMRTVTHTCPTPPPPVFAGFRGHTKWC